LTYKCVPKSDSEFSFEKVESSFLLVTFIIGGFLIVLFGLIAPIYGPLKLGLILFGLVFFGAAFYLPHLGERFSPQSISFDKLSQEIKIAMADGDYCKLPFRQIEDIEIVVEKRSPSAANSTGIHYLHYHINIKRTNGGIFTVTSTTDKQEAEQTCNFLKQTLTVGELTLPNIEPRLPSKIQVMSSETLEVRWQLNRYGLSIGEQLVYSEYKSDGNVMTSKEFPIKSLSHVAYTYASTIQNKNFSVYLHFNQHEPTKLGLFLKDLNPVECLQFENWLHQTIQKKLSS
jgi:hypothetical protein